MPSPVTTYSTLLADVAKYAERKDADFITQVPKFVALAEFRLATEAKGLGYVRVVRGTIKASDPTIAKPRNWRQTKSFSLTTVTSTQPFLRPRKYEYCKYYAAEAGLAQPEYYSDIDYKNFFIAATPDKDYPFELSFYEKPAPLSDSNQTNWTTENAPQLLLYATLVEAMPFLKNNTMMPVWQAQYAELVSAVGKEEVNSGHDATE